MDASTVNKWIGNLLLLAAIGAPIPGVADVRVLDKIVAVVDEGVVLESEVQQRMQTVVSQLSKGDASQLPPDDVLRGQVIDRLILENLELQMADRAGVRISDEDLNDAMSRIASQNQMSLAQFRQAIEADGISYAQMREQIRQEIAIARVQQGVMHGRIKISDQEIKNFLASEVGQMVTADEYRVAHILVTVPGDASADQLRVARSTADDILAQLNAGADFQSLAVQKSAGQNALEGGDLGWRKAVQLPTMFSDLVPAMAVGEVGGPIKSGSGFHVIKLLEKRGAAAEGQVGESHIRHVLIKPSEIRNDHEAYELAEQLRNEVIAGRAFDEVATIYSNDPGSALSGGDLGWNRAGTFVDAFEAQANALAIDELSEVFHSEHGYHFLQVMGRRVEDFSGRFRESQAENYLRNQRFDEELENWAREIREDAFVEIRSVDNAD